MAKANKNLSDAAKIAHKKKVAAERDAKRLAKLNNLLFKELL